MIIILKQSATEQELKHIEEFVEGKGLKIHRLSHGTEKVVLGLVGETRALSKPQIESLPGVEEVVAVLKPYKLASREFHPKNTVVEVNGVKIGSKDFVVIAGPCSVESEEQFFEVAHAVKKAGAKILRGSAYKPRTSPYDFQGLGDRGLKILKKVGRELDMPVETEIMDSTKVDLIAKHVDMLRIGARNMQNFDLLKAVGKINKPVILKNGLSATINEFLMAAEYIMSEGNQNVVLCERGIRTFETETRFTLDLNTVTILKNKTHLPIIVDPSHACGKSYLVPALSKAAVAAGADGLLVEAHPSPEKALSDAQQQLNLPQFASFMEELKPIVKAVSRKI